MASAAYRLSTILVGIPSAVCRMLARARWRLCPVPLKNTEHGVRRGYARWVREARIKQPAARYSVERGLTKLSLLSPREMARGSASRAALKQRQDKIRDHGLGARPQRLGQ